MSLGTKGSAIDRPMGDSQQSGADSEDDPNIEPPSEPPEDNGPTTVVRLRGAPVSRPYAFLVRSGRVVMLSLRVTRKHAAAPEFSRER